MKKVHTKFLTILSLEFVATVSALFFPSNRGPCSGHDFLHPFGQKWEGHVCTIFATHVPSSYFYQFADVLFLTIALYAVVSLVSLVSGKKIIK